MFTHAKEAPGGWNNAAMDAADAEFVRLYPKRSNRTFAALAEITRMAKRLQAAK